MGWERVAPEIVVEALIEISRPERSGVMRCLPRSVIRRLAEDANGRTVKEAVLGWLAFQTNARLQVLGAPQERVAELNALIPPPVIRPDRGGPG